MKKKQCILLLSFSLVFSTLAPSIIYAEENEILTDEVLESDTGEISESEVMENNTSISIDSIQQVELDTPVTMEEQAAVQELADAEDVKWNDLVDYNLRYRYEDNVLYVELLNKNESQKATNFNVDTDSPWRNAEARTVTKIVIGNGINNIGPYWFNAGTTTYYGKLKEVVLPSTVTKVGDYAFNGDKALQAINLENVQEIGKGAFQMNKALLQLQLNSVKSIGKYAFNQCTTLPYLTLGQSDVQVGEGAFASCRKLKTICYAGTKDSWSAICASENDRLKRATAVHCKGEETKPKDATCTEEGYESLTCTICGDSYAGNVIEALGHDYADEYTVDVAPTCTEKGFQSKHCTRCGEADPDSVEELAALGHEYAAEYTVDAAATCTAAGSQSKHCTRCGEADPDSIQEIPALGHEYVSKVTKTATCTEDGVQTDTCTRCGDVKTQTIKATGHQWSDWTKTADATVSGAEQQQRTCTVCGTVETKDVGEKLAPTATVNASTVTLKAKQSTKGLKVTGLAKGDSVATWKSTNTKVFTVKGNADGSCTLTGKKKGSAKLEITLASGLTKTVTVKVQKTAVKTSKVKVAEKKLTVKKGEKASLKATVAPFTSAQKLTYTSSNKKVATVSKDGVVTAKKAGTAKIAVKSGSKKVTVTITVPKTKTSSITVAKDITVKKGKTYRLKAKVAPKNSDEKITYTSSNKKIATVTKSGKVKGIKKGTATITVKSGSETVKVNVTVK